MSATAKKSASKAVAKPAPAPAPVPQQSVADESASLLAVIQNAARDPNVDIDKMERLMGMHEKALARRAAATFAAALAAVQDELPAIAERGKVVVDGQVRSTYAKWEDVNTVIKPILKKHGLALSFRTDQTDTAIKITAVLSHVDGHTEETSLVLPADNSGKKNAVQAIGSTVSYGKRYTGGALLNLTSHGEDDDAYLAGVVVDEDVLQDWRNKFGECESVEALRDCKVELLELYGTATAIPKQITVAFNERFIELQKHKPGEGE